MEYNKLKKTREEKNFSQLDIANYLNISRQSVSKWENGKAHPDIETLVKLSDLYNISLDELVNHDTSALKPKSTLTSDIKFLDEWLLLLILVFLLALISPFGIFFIPIIYQRNKKNTIFHKTINFACIVCLIINLYNSYIILKDSYDNNIETSVEYIPSNTHE